MAKQKPSSRLVYSTDQGKMCSDCRHPIRSCSCHRNHTPSRGDGIVRVGRQTKGRKGKGVSTIEGIPLHGTELKNYVAELKKKCGTGGAVKGDVVEIQGDHRDWLVVELRCHGWVVKRSGA